MRMRGAQIRIPALYILLYGTSRPTLHLINVRFTLHWRGCGVYALHPKDVHYQIHHAIWFQPPVYELQSLQAVQITLAA